MFGVAIEAALVSGELREIIYTDSKPVRNCGDQGDTESRNAETFKSRRGILRSVIAGLLVRDFNRETVPRLANTLNGEVAFPERPGKELLEVGLERVPCGFRIRR